MLSERSLSHKTTYGAGMDGEIFGYKWKVTANGYGVYF